MTSSFGSKIGTRISVLFLLFFVAGCDTNSSPQNGNGVSSFDSLDIGNLVQSVAFSPDGQWISVGTYYSSQDPTNVFLARMVDDKVVTPPIGLKGHTDDVKSVTFSPDSQTLATGSYDGTVRLWKVSDPKSAPRVLNVGSKVVQVVFSPDGQQLAVTDYTHQIYLWPVANLDSSPRHLPGSNVAFSPDGKMLAAGSGNSVYVWQEANPQTAPIQLSGSDSPNSLIASVVFSPDSQTLAAGDFDDEVRLWDTQHFNQPPALLTTGNPAADTANVIFSLAFSPDGKQLAAGLDRESRPFIYIWSTEQSHNLLSVLQGQIDKITSVTYSPDGKLFASASNDGTVRLWHLNFGQ